MIHSRRKARITVLEILYQFDIADGDVDCIIDSQLEKRRPHKDVKDFVLQLVKGVLEKRPEIDRLIGSHAEHWSCDRMTVIDRNILRLAVFELLYCSATPFKVVINEAVEIGKLYGTEDSAAFVNGILDKIVRGIASRKGEIAGVVGKM